MDKYQFNFNISIKMDFSSFIHKISDAQAYIQNEKLLLELRSTLNSNEIDENKNQIKRILRKLKKYWLGQFLIKMERKYQNNTSKFRFSDKNYSDFFLTKDTYDWNELKDAQREILKKFDIDSFKKFCLNLKPTEKNNDFISFITLSVAPSIYNFFISAKNYMYIELIFEISDEKIKKKFVKTLFLIPSFVNFVSTSFHSIILPFENNEKDDFGNEKSFVQLLLQSWINNMNLCPKFIRKYFENTVKQNSCIEELMLFFKHLFNCPDIYQITHFYNKKLPSIFYNDSNRIFQFLTENKNVVKNFALAFFSEIDSKDVFNGDQIDSNYRNDLEQQDENNEFNDIFLPDTFDSYDIQFLIDLINKNYVIPRFLSVKDLLDKEYKLFIFSNENNITIAQPVIENSESQPLDSFKTCFKKLLKHSEPLPEFPESYLKEKDPNFIENYLVYRGPFSGFPKREKLFLLLKSFAVDPLKKLMKMDFDEFFNESNNDGLKDENIYSVALHRTIISNAEKINFPVQSQMLQILEYNFLLKKFDSISQQKDFRTLSEKLNTADLINDPKKLKELFNIYSNYFQNDASYSSIPDFSIQSKKVDFKFSRNSYFILYQTKNLTFNMFLNERKDVLPLDKTFIKMVSSRDLEKNEMFIKLKTFFNSLDYFNKLNFLNKLNIFNKDDSNSLKSKVLNEKFNFYAENLKKAFSADTNPLQKIIDISRAFADIQKFIVEENEIEIERGDIVAIRDIILSIVKPPHFVSSMIFMFDYYFIICNDKNQLKVLFEQMFNIAYRNGNEKVKENILYKHLLICRESLRISFFGDDKNDSIKTKIISKILENENKNDFSFKIESILGKSKNLTYHYLHNLTYYVCQIDLHSVDEKLNDKDPIDLNIIAFDDDNENVFKKINDAKKIVKNKFRNSKLFKEFTYVICDKSFHDQMKKNVSDKIFDLNDNVMGKIIDDYQKKISIFK